MKSEACAAHELAVQSIPLFDFQMTFRRWSFLQFLDKFHEFRHCLRGMESALMWHDWYRERRPPTCLCRRGGAVKDFLCYHRRLSTNGYKWYRSHFLIFYESLFCSCTTAPRFHDCMTLSTYSNCPFKSTYIISYSTTALLHHF